MTRAAVATDVSVDILIRSRRRCCLCYFWDFDATQKEGQLAHVDRDASNSSADNLAYLCFRHHNIYDSQQRIGRNVTPGELRYARKLLYDEMRSKPSVNLVVTVEIDRDFETFSDADQTQVMETIRNAIQRNSEVRVISRESGSVRLKFEMPSDQVARLLDAIHSGELADINVVDADIDRLSDPDVFSRPQIRLDEVPRLDLPVELFKEDRHLLVLLAISAFDLSPVDVRKNAALAVTLGAAEELRLITAYGRLLDGALTSLQHASNDLSVEVSDAAFDFDRIVDTIEPAIQQYRAGSEEIRTKTKLYADHSAIWFKFGTVIKEADEALSELQRSCIAEAEDRENTPDTRAAIRRHLDHTIHELMDPRAFLGEEHDQCKEALVKLVTFSEFSGDARIKTDPDAI